MCLSITIAFQIHEPPTCDTYTCAYTPCTSCSLVLWGCGDSVEFKLFTTITERTQSVVVDGASSKPVPVMSGVLQRTVLDPLKIKSPQDSISLQDLNLLSHWPSIW